jgi:translation initiation factor 4B
MTDDSYDRPEVPIPDEAPFTAYTGNLSFETTEADLTDFFSSIGCEQVR